MKKETAGMALMNLGFSLLHFLELNCKLAWKMVTYE